MKTCLPQVYVDFNAIEYLDENHSAAVIPLTGYGTLISLAQQKLRLTEGLDVLIYEPNDIECDATTHFDVSRTDPAGRQGEWVARFDALNIRASTIAEMGHNEHPCIVCGNHFPSIFAPVRRDFTERCSKCGASVMEPLSPPNQIV